jgi:quinol-cytochrome oxidoreductase complex cytochrome b subunit
MGWAILILLVLPWLDPYQFRSTFFKLVYALLYVAFILIMLILGWLGQEAVEYPFLQFSSLISLFYFGFFKLISLDHLL